MLIIALFAIAAVLGATLAVRHFQGKPLPLPVALTHGAFAASGIVALYLTGASAGFSELRNTALIVFVIAALGGATLFTIHMRTGKLPTALVLGHAAGALIAFGILLAAAFGK